MRRPFRLAVLVASCVIIALLPVRSAHAADAVETARRWLGEKGWREGFDPASKRLVVLVSAGFKAPPSPAAYVTARQAAFDTSMADARKKAAEFLSAEVESAIRTRTDLQTVIGDPELAKRLTGMASDEAFRATADFRQSVAVVARASIAGIYACQTFESSDGAGSARIAVVAAVSPDSAEAVRGGKSGPCDGKGIDGWLESVTDEALACTFGLRFVYDRGCVMRPVSFGQAVVRQGMVDDGAALAVAEAIAVRHLGESLGESVASRALSESLSRSEESSAAPPSFRSLESFESDISSASRSKFGPGEGPQVVGRRLLKDPASGAQLVVVAVTVTPGAAAAAVAPKTADTPVAAARGCPPVPARMADSVRQVRASGTGPGKSAALEAALYEAVRRDGTSVKGDSLLQRRYSEAIDSLGEEVREKASSRLNMESNVQTFANGFIHSYEVIRESQSGGLWEVEACANLVRFDPKDPRFGLPPTVAVMPFACSANSVKAGGAAVPCEQATAPCEQALDRALGASGAFVVLAERDIRQLAGARADVARRVASGQADEMEAIKLGRELTADFVLLGKVLQAEYTGLAGQRPQRVDAGHTAVASVTARLVNLASGEETWSESATVTLKARDILEVRAGRGMQDPSEAALSPLQLALSRATRQITDSLAAKFGGRPSARAPDGGRGAAPANSPVRIVRVAGGMVTLDAANPAVAVGARFAVNLLVDVSLPGGRTEVDRDRVATIEVVSVSGALAKASVVDGDASAIDPAKCEAVPAAK